MNRRFIDMKSVVKKVIAGIIVAAMVVSMAMTAFAAESRTKVTPYIVIRSNIAAGMTVDEQHIEVVDNIDSYTSVPEGTVYIGYSQTDLGRPYVIDGGNTEFKSSASHKITMGEEIKLSVALTIPDSSDYYFGSTCKVSGAEKSGYSRADENTTAYIIVKLKGAQGRYGDPEDAHWGNTRGMAKWTAPEFTSGYYEVKLYRGSSSVGSVTVHGTSCNFYYKDWMGKKGEYTFKVRTVPNPSSTTAKTSWKSDYAESDDIYLEENQVATAAGSPQGYDGGGDSPVVQAGWVQSGGTWYYVYPDGTLKKNGWEKVNGKWYLFDKTGAMLTGWQNSGNCTYYLDATNGDMKVGWLMSSNNVWYYMNPTIGGPEGSMVKNSWIIDKGFTYYLTDSGAMAVGWQNIGGKYYYFRPEAGGPMGSLVTNQYIGTFYVGADGAWVH